MSKTSFRFLLGLLVMSGAIAASAQPVAVASTAPPAAVEKRAVDVVLTQKKVVKAADGTEKLVDAVSVKPGDIVEYRATYTNQSGKAVNRLVGSLPIPEGLEYLPKSAKPGSTLVKMATKDGVFAAEPLMHQVNGKAEPVPYGDYRSLRWSLDQLPAGGVTSVTARARIQTLTVPASAASAASAVSAQAPGLTVKSAAAGASR